jgi:hypothetical protein
MPDNGGTTFIAMTNNAVLYHCEGSGADSSGNGNTATFSNVTTGAVGKVGSFAWSFDTNTAYASPTVGVALGANWTIAFWFYNLSATADYRVAAYGANWPIIVDGSGNLGTFSGAMNASGAVMLAASYTGWHHLVAVGSGTTTAYYLDGVLVGTAAFKSTTSVVNIGNQNGTTRRFADRIDEYAIWTRALSAAEISALWLNQVGGYAGAGTTFGFTPDVTGTYTIQYSQGDSKVGGTYTDLANAVISFTGYPISQGNVGQGFIDQNGEGVGQGRSFSTQGARAQGS